MNPPGESLAENTWTIMRLVQWTQGYFKRKDVDSPRLSAEVLLAHLLGYDRVKLYTNFDEVVADDRLASFRELVLKRGRGVPVKYLTGHAEFMSLDFIVTPDVLIPRPETELLVEKVLEFASDIPEPVIAEIGTGCGNIAVSLAVNLPGARIWATDISQKALTVAERNAERASVAEPIEFLCGHLYEPLTDSGSGGKFDIICSNPPYIPDGQWNELSPEIRDHEPEIALKAGHDGLKYLIPLIEGAPKLLKSAGRLFVEIGEDQARAVTEAAVRTGAFSATEVFKDYGGHNRALMATRFG